MSQVHLHSDSAADLPIVPNHFVSQRPTHPAPVLSTHLETTHMPKRTRLEAREVGQFYRQHKNEMSIPEGRERLEFRTLRNRHLGVHELGQREAEPST